MTHWNIIILLLFRFRDIQYLLYLSCLLFNNMTLYYAVLSCFILYNIMYPNISYMNIIYYLFYISFTVCVHMFYSPLAGENKNIYTYICYVLFMFCAVLRVWFCTGHLVMVLWNITCLHCLQHFFEHVFNLYFQQKLITWLLLSIITKTLLTYFKSLIYAHRK